MKCILCEKDLEQVHEDNDEQVFGGLVIRHFGSFGSRVWDPMGDEYLLFAICDNCLQEHSQFIRVRRRTHVTAERLAKDEPWQE